MAIMKTDTANYSAIADAIRDKGVEGTWKPAEMPDAIAAIQGGGDGDTGLDFEKIYRKLREGLPPTMDAKTAYDTYGEEYFKGCTYAYTGLILKPTSAVTLYNMTGLANLYGYYNDDGEFIVCKEYDYTASTNTSSFSSSTIPQWGSYKGTEYIIWIGLGGNTTFQPYTSTTSYSYANRSVDVDIYYNAEMNYGTTYFRRLDLIYPDMRFLRVKKGPNGKYIRSVTSDDYALYYKYSGPLQLIRALEFNIDSTGNGIFISAGKLIGYNGPMSSDSTGTVYGQACFPTCYYYKVGPITMRTAVLPAPSSIPGDGYWSLSIEYQQLDYIALTSYYFPVEIHLDNISKLTSTSYAIYGIRNLKTLLSLANTLPEYDKSRFASNVVYLVNDKIPVSLYQKELQPLFDKGWTITGGI